MVAMRPPFRTALRVVLVIVLLWGAWEIWYRLELRRYNALAAPILAEADTTQQLASAVPVGEDDAARYYAAAAVAAIGEGPLQPTPASMIGLVQRVRLNLINRALPAPRDTELAQQAVASNEVSIQLAARGAELTFRRFAPGTSFNNRMSGMIGVHAALALRTLDAIRASDVDTAGQAIYSRIRLLRALEPETFPSTEKARQMTELASDVGLWLALTPPVEHLNQVAAALSEPYRYDELVPVIARQARFWAGTNGETARRAGWLAPVVLRLASPTMQSTAAALSAARHPWPQRLAEVRRLSDDGHHVAFGAQTTTINVAIGIAANRASRIAIAAELARRGGTTGSPLSEPAVAGETSVDPFTGTSLLFVRDDGGFVVYSVGPNGQDDRGNVNLPAAGRAPSIPQGRDVGVRVVDGRRR